MPPPAAVSAGSAEVKRKSAAAADGKRPGWRMATRQRGALARRERRGDEDSGEEDSGSVVLSSQPEHRATILRKTRISRPQRRPGRLAGRAEYPGRQRAPPGLARASGRNARGRVRRCAPPI